MKAQEKLSCSLDVIIAKTRATPEAKPGGKSKQQQQQQQQQWQRAGGGQRGGSPGAANGTARHPGRGGFQQWGSKRANQPQPQQQQQQYKQKQHHQRGPFSHAAPGAHASDGLAADADGLAAPGQPHYQRQQCDARSNDQGRGGKARQRGGRGGWRTDIQGRPPHQLQQQNNYAQRGSDFGAGYAAAEAEYLEGQGMRHRSSSMDAAQPAILAAAAPAYSHPPAAPDDLDFVYFHPQEAQPGAMGPFRYAINNGLGTAGPNWQDGAGRAPPVLVDDPGIAYNDSGQRASNYYVDGGPNSIAYASRLRQATHTVHTVVAQADEDDNDDDNGYGGGVSYRGRGGYSAQGGAGSMQQGLRHAERSDQAPYRHDAQPRGHDIIDDNEEPRRPPGGPPGYWRQKEALGSRHWDSPPRAPRDARSPAPRPQPNVPVEPQWVDDGSRSHKQQTSGGKRAGDYDRLQASPPRAHNNPPAATHKRARADYETRTPSAADRADLRHPAYRDNRDERRAGNSPPRGRGPAPATGVKTSVAAPRSDGRSSGQRAVDGSGGSGSRVATDIKSRPGPAQERGGRAGNTPKRPRIEFPAAEVAERAAAARRAASLEPPAAQQDGGHAVAEREERIARPQDKSGAAKHAAGGGSDRAGGGVAAKATSAARKPQVDDNFGSAKQQRPERAGPADRSTGGVARTAAAAVPAGSGGSSRRYVEPTDSLLAELAADAGALPASGRAARPTASVSAAGPKQRAAADHTSTASGAHHADEAVQAAAAGVATQAPTPGARLLPAVVEDDEDQEYEPSDGEGEGGGAVGSAAVVGAGPTELSVVSSMPPPLPRAPAAAQSGASAQPIDPRTRGGVRIMRAPITLAAGSGSGGHGGFVGTHGFFAPPTVMRHAEPARADMLPGGGPCTVLHPSAGPADGAAISDQDVAATVIAINDVLTKQAGRQVALTLQQTLKVQASLARGLRYALLPDDAVIGSNGGTIVRLPAAVVADVEGAVDLTGYGKDIMLTAPEVPPGQPAPLLRRIFKFILHQLESQIDYLAVLRSAPEYQNLPSEEVAALLMHTVAGVALPPPPAPPPQQPHAQAGVAGGGSGVEAPGPGLGPGAGAASVPGDTQGSVSSGSQGPAQGAVQVKAEVP